MAETVAVTCSTCGAVFFVNPEKASKTTQICGDCAQ